MPEFQCRIADWQQEAVLMRQIRETVFVQEQNVPLDMEWDEHDETATHFLIFHEHEAIGTARLLADGQIGRMAILASWRQHGAGKLLLETVVRTACKRNLESVFMHAQVSAIGFYEKAGFICEGNEFMEAGIAHRAMSRKCAK